MTDHPPVLVFATVPASRRLGFGQAFEFLEVACVRDALVSIHGPRTLIGAIVEARLAGDAVDDVLAELRQVHGPALPVLFVAPAAHHGPGSLCCRRLDASILGAFERRLRAYRSSYDLERLARRAQLSGQERWCLRAFARGRTRQQIADQLGVAPSTVSTVLRRMRVKTGAASLVELRAWLEPRLAEV